MKKTKKLFIAFLTVIMLMTMTSVGVAAETTLPTGTWSVNVVVDGVTHKVTSTDVAKLTPRTVAATYTNNAGTTTTAYFTGVRLKDVLASIGVTDVTTVKAETSDNYSTTPYDKATAMNDNTLLAWGTSKVDANSIAAIDLKGNTGYNPVMLIPGGSNLQGQQFIKYVTTVTVTGATLAKTSASTSTSTTSTAKTSTSTTTTTSNPTTGDSSPISAEIILLVMASMLAVAVTVIGMRKSYRSK